MLKQPFLSLSLFSSRALVASLVAVMFTACQSDKPSFSLTSVQQNLKQGSIIKQTSKVDILWVIDNSGSMKASQDELANNFDIFISNFSQKNLDYQIAVTSTDAYLSSPAYNSQASSELSKFRTGNKGSTNSGVPIITPQTKNLQDVFLTNIKLGTSGHPDERAFSSLEETLKNSSNQSLIRPDSFLAVIIVSDEEDFSRDQMANQNYTAPKHNVERYIKVLDQATSSTSGAKRYNVSSIHILTGDENCMTKQRDAQPGEQGQKYGARYESLVSATGGNNISLCGDFNQSLDILSKSIIESTIIDSFTIERKPIVSTIKISVNGQSVPMSVNGSDGWEYNLSENGEYTITFIGASVPDPGAEIAINFDPETFEEK